MKKKAQFFGVLKMQILAFEKEFKLHTVYWTLFWGFRADKTSTTHWSGCRVQVWVQVRAPANLLRFESNSTETSDGGVQKLGNDVWHDSESIATTVCSPIGRKRNATCPRKGRLLTFKLHSTETSDGGVQKLGNDVWHDSELIATTACSPISSKWNVMFESHVVTGRALIFNLKIFLSNLPL